MTQITFKALKSKGALFGISVGFLIILSPIIAIYLTEGIDGFSWGWAILFPGGLFAFFTYVLIASLFKMFITYSINNDGLTIYKPPFHKKQFSWDEIEAVELLTGEETKKQMEDLILEQNSYGDNEDILGYIKMIRNKAPYYKYYTQSPSGKSIHKGEKDTLVSLKVNDMEGIILLQLKNGRTHYLSPENPKQFLSVFLQFNNSQKQE